MRKIRLILIILLALFTLVSVFSLKAQVPPWQANTSYGTGALVTYNGTIYRCVQAHTSLAGWEPPNTPALWTVETGRSTNTPGGTTATSTPTKTATRTNTPSSPTATHTPTRTNTPMVSTNTPLAPTATRTNTPSIPTNTPLAPTATRTDAPSGANCHDYPAWLASSSYPLGAIVYYVHNGNYYQVAHVDSTGGTTNANPLASPYYWQPYSCTTPVPILPTCSGFTCVISEAQFNSWFRSPNRNAFYTYANFLTARNAYPGFASSTDLIMNKREAAAFFAHVAHETSYLFYIHEQNYQIGHYCEKTGNGPQYGCASGADYHGRGPLQLSWNYNYKMASNGQYYATPGGWTNVMNPTVGADIWSNPDIVATDGVIAWKTALWYWMNHGKDWDPPKGTVHDDFINIGFGQTTRDINGGLECDGKNSAQMQHRVSIYDKFLADLGISDNRPKTC